MVAHIFDGVKDPVPGRFLWRYTSFSFRLKRTLPFVNIDVHNFISKRALRLMLCRTNYVANNFP